MTIAPEWLAHIKSDEPGKAACGSLLVFTQFAFESLGEHLAGHQPGAACRVAKKPGRG